MPQVDRTVEHLPQRLGRLEPVPFGNAEAPCVDVPRREMRKPRLAEHCRRFAEQPAQLRDRHGCSLVYLQVLVDELPKRDGCSSATWAEPIEHLAQRLLRLRMTGEAVYLRAFRAAPLKPIPYAHNG